MASGVTKNTFVVVVKNLDEDTGKAEKARDLGIPMETVGEFHAKTRPDRSSDQSLRVPYSLHKMFLKLEHLRRGLIVELHADTFFRSRADSRQEGALISRSFISVVSTTICLWIARCSSRNIWVIW